MGKVHTNYDGCNGKGHAQHDCRRKNLHGHCASSPDAFFVGTGQSQQCFAQVAAIFRYAHNPAEEGVERTRVLERLFTDQPDAMDTWDFRIARIRLGLPEAAAASATLSAIGTLLASNRPKVRA